MKGVIIPFTKALTPLSAFILESLQLVPSLARKAMDGRKFGISTATILVPASLLYRNFSENFVCLRAIHFCFEFVGSRACQCKKWRRKWDLRSRILRSIFLFHFCWSQLHHKGSPLYSKASAFRAKLHQVHKTGNAYCYCERVTAPALHRGKQISFGSK